MGLDGKWRQMSLWERPSESRGEELEKRGHAFVRYADDCNVYVRSRRAGQRVLGVLRKLYARLRLRVNESKSAVASAFHRPFLGFAFWVGSGGPTPPVETGSHDFPRAEGPRSLGLPRRRHRTRYPPLLVERQQAAPSRPDQLVLRRARALPARSMTSTSRTAEYGPVRSVVWEGIGRALPADPLSRLRQLSVADRFESCPHPRPGPALELESTCSRPFRTPSRTLART